MCISMFIYLVLFSLLVCLMTNVLSEVWGRTFVTESRGKLSHEV